MSRKTTSGSHRKVDTAKHRKRQKRELENRAVKDKRRVQREVEFAERIKPRSDAPLVCTLCNQPITQEDQKGNVHTVRLGRKEVQVHRTCPASGILPY